MYQALVAAGGGNPSFSPIEQQREGAGLEGLAEETWLHAKIDSADPLCVACQMAGAGDGKPHMRREEFSAEDDAEPTGSIVRRDSDSKCF